METTVLFTLDVLVNGTTNTINGTYVVDSATKTIQLSTATETNFITLLVNSYGNLVFNYQMPTEGEPKACVKTYKHAGAV